MTQDRSAAAYVAGVAGILPLDDDSIPGLAQGIATRQMIERLGRFRDLLLQVDAAHPELEIRNGLVELREKLIANKDFHALADGLEALMQRAHPYLPKV